MLENLKLELRQKENYNFEKDGQYEYELSVTKGDKTAVFNLFDTVEYQFADDETVKKMALIDALSNAGAYDMTPDRDEFLASIQTGEKINDVDIKIYENCKASSCLMKELFTNEEFKLLNEEVDAVMQEEINEWMEEMDR